MDEVVRKRVIGAAVLIALGIALPVLLSRCMHMPTVDNQAMHVYEIQPSGDIEPVAAATQNTKQPPREPATTAPTPPADQIADEAVTDAAQNIASATLARETGSDEQAQSPAQEPVAPVKAEPEPKSESQSATASPQPSQKQTDAVESTPAADRDSPAVDEAQAKLEQTAPAGTWVVQVASFSTEKDARALAKQLDDAYAVFYTSAEVNGSTWYRVRVGPFDNDAAATNAAAELRAQGRDTLVVRID